MPNWPERATTALTVYLERGFRALEFIRAESWDELDGMLSLRTAAFHNFRAADHLALLIGYSAQADAKMKGTWGQIVEVDRELLEEMVQAQQKMNAEIARMSKVKATIGRFKSGQIQESKMEKPV